MPADDLPTPIAEGSYEWYRREVERLQIENEVLRISAAGAEGRVDLLIKAIARVRSMADAWRTFEAMRGDTAADAVYTATDIKGVTS